jgi:hypothetical protein
MYPNAVAVSLPVHASWLNQVEMHFSILQRKVLTPSDFMGRAEAAEGLVNFGRLFAREAEPFNRSFARADLRKMLAKLYAAEHTEASLAPMRKAA